MNAAPILPGTGRGTIRRMVEGASLGRSTQSRAPSVSRFAAATSPSRGGLFEFRKTARHHIVAFVTITIGGDEFGLDVEAPYSGKNPSSNTIGRSLSLSAV